MTPEQDARADQLFDELLDLPEVEQHRRLAAVAAEDVLVAAAVRSWLDADAEGDDPLAADVGRLAQDLLPPELGHEFPRPFGRFVIEAFIAEGGMGAVYRARRPDLEDTVAIKVLPHAWMSPVHVRRFAREQRTLAALQHPHIARLYDAGVTEGVPWFAMEYVEGRATIADYAQAHRLGLRARLDLFRAACEAVDYAHRQFIVHLDLKPSNILVDGSGRVKLVDFGIARRLAEMGLGAEQTMHRAWSPDYAAPEQVLGERLDAQADVYSLGIVLRELLVTSPGLVVSKAERRELDAICLAALRHDKALRYRSVEHLLADLARFDNHEPLKARAGALRRYRLGKFIVRHRRPAAITAAVVLTIAALSLFFTLRLIDARDRAIGSEARTRRIHGLMLNLFSGDAAAAGPASSLRVVDLLERGVRDAAALRDEPALQADLRYTLGGLYHRLGHFDRADPLLTEAWKTRQALFGDPDRRTVQVRMAIAALRIDQDELEQAESVLRDVLAVAEGRPTVEATEVAAARALLGRIVATRGDYADAFPLLENAVAVLSGAPPGIELSEALGELGNARYYHGEIAEAEAIFERALRLDRTLFGPRHPHVAIDLLNLGNVALDRGEYDRALQLYREALSINDGWFRAPHPKIAHDLLMVGRSLSYLGQPRQAGEMYARALDQTLAVFPAVHPRVGQIYSLQGDLARDEGALDEADRLFQKSAAIFGEASGESHQFTLHQRSNLASVLLARDDHRAAEAALRPVVARLAAAVPRARYTALAEIRLAQALIGQKRYEEARGIALAGYARLRPLTGPANAELRAGRACLVAIYRGLGQPEKARAFIDPVRGAGLPMR